MAQRTMTRRAPNRPAEPGQSAPAQMLVPRRATHLRDGVALAGAGAAGYGAAAMTGYPQWDIPALALGLGAGSLVAVAGERGRRRRELQDRLVEALAPHLGVRQLDRRTVRLSGWTAGWPGLPRRVSVRYAPGAPDGDPVWKAEVAAVLTGRLLATYKLVRHDQRRCRLALRLIPDADKDQSGEPPHSQVRAERAITELIGPTAKVLGVERAGDELRTITVAHQAGAKLAASGYRARIERVISTMMPGRWRAVWDLEGDTVRFEVRPTLPSSVWLPAQTPDNADDLLQTYRQVKIPYAIDEDGNELVWYPATSPHAMLTGGTGTGKTSAAHALLGKVTQYGWPVWVLDAKRVEFLDLRDWPNVQIVAGSIEHQVALIHAAWQLMEHRYHLVETGQVSINDFEPLVVFLDEFAEFRSNLVEWYAQIKVKGDPTKPPTLAEVASLARKARTARIHLVLSTQRPDAEFLGGEALAVDTPIPTPDGWTTMGEITVGQHVFGVDGRSVRVTAATEFAVGRPCYRVRFSDGSSLVTDENHLWSARSAAQRGGDRVAMKSLSRSERWPGHAMLADRLAGVADAEREVTVSQFEEELSQGRVAMLRRGINDGRWGLEPVGTRCGEAGRFDARTYRRRDLIGALQEELASPAPTWRQVPPQIVTTGHMAETLVHGGRESNWSVRVADPIDLPDADLPIDPWLLGYWLGDGHKAAATIATADEEVLDRIRALGYRVTHYARFNYGISTGQRGGAPRPTLQGALRNLGLLHNKHIPVRYLRASIRQRSQLLEGLLDSDGTCAVRRRRTVLSGQVSFTNVDRGLIDGVVELAASLGFIPTVRQSRAAGVESYGSSVAYGSRLRVAWQVSFTPDRQVFGIGRKQRVLEPALAGPRRVKTRQRYVVSVDPVASVPVRCITVDSSDHLYLAGRTFIPTHNCRDNFGQRMSMGRLSPQGAMMMWENPAVGVSLPRACTGRATATHEDGRPVEVQCYRFPDLNAAEGTEEHALLEAIRPKDSRHPRLVIIPPKAEQDLESGEVDSPTFRDYAGATWELASQRPDLDPLARAEEGRAVDGRSLSSTLASLGLAGDPSPPRHLRLLDPAVENEPAAADGAPRPEDSWEDAGDDYAGYGPVGSCNPMSLVVGDLIEAEEDSGTWVVVDEPPEEDVVAPGMVAVSWRGDGDESGSISLPDDLNVAVRRPEEDG